MLDRIDGSILAGAIGWAINGFAERNPELAAKKDAILNPYGRRIVDEQRIGRLTPTVPVLISIGRNDDLIPFDQAKELADAWESRGADVVMVVDDFPSVAPGTALNHSVASPATETAALEFLARHLGGEVAPGS